MSLWQLPWIFVTIQEGKTATSNINRQSGNVFRLFRIHPRNKWDVGYRLSRSGLAVAYGFNNVTYLGPIIANITVASDSKKINVTYSNEASPGIEVRNWNGFEVCLSFLWAHY